MTPSKLVDRFKKDTIRTVADNSARQEMLYRWTIKIITLICTVSGILNVFLGDYKMGIILIGLAGVYFVNYWIVYLGKEKGVAFTSVLMNVEYIFIYGYFLIKGYSDGFSATWVLILPPIVILLTGRFLGTITCALTFLMLVVCFWTPLGGYILQFHYNIYFQARFPILFLTVYVLAFFIDSIREMTMQELVRIQQKVNRIYEKQYRELRERIQDARRARHDLRHHLVMIDKYLEDGKIDEVRDYISNYYQSLPFEESLTYCDHYGTNALLTYVWQRAHNEHVECDIKVNFPAELPIPDDALTIVFGNLLENALDASVEGLELDPDFRAKITVRGNLQGNMLLFSVQNYTKKAAKMDQEHHYISSKHEGLGIGIDSVRTVAKSYHGNLEITQENGLFIARVIMQFNQNDEK